MTVPLSRAPDDRLPELVCAVDVMRSSRF